MNRNIGLLILMLIFGIPVSAQIGEHRNDFAIGFNGGYMMSSVGFTPEVQQKQHSGLTRPSVLSMPRFLLDKGE